MMNLMINNGATSYVPSVKGGITWSLERSGVPGKLEFSVVQDKVLELSEGNRVCLIINDVALFQGFVFEKKYSKDRIVSVTAYDQLRYLKNKDTYRYEDKTATEVIQMIASDFNLSVGVLEDTGFKIAARVEPDKSLFDIILNALDLTMISTKQMYILYDEYGALTLKNVENMKLDLLICQTTAENYDYSSSIDGDTYNQVKVSIDNEESGKRDVYVTKDTANINAWGVLQYYHKADKEGSNGVALADSLLLKYNQKTKKLSIKNALGDLRVRPGCLLPVMLDLTDEKMNHYMLVEKVTHSFEGMKHLMDLTLRGGGFNA